MKKRTEEFMKEVNELKELSMKKVMEDVDIRYVDTTEFEFAKRTLRLLDTFEDLMLEAAGMMDNMDKKLDKLLAK